MVMLIALTLSSITLAGGWSEVTKVKKVWVVDSGYLYAEFDDYANPDNCPNSDNWIRIESSLPAKDAVYTALLTALTSKQDVTYYVTGCNGAFPILYHLILQ